MNILWFLVFALINFAFALLRLNQGQFQLGLIHIGLSIILLVLGAVTADMRGRNN